MVKKSNKKNDNIKLFEQLKKNQKILYNKK